MIIPHSKILPRNMLGSRLLPLVIAVNVYLATLEENIEAATVRLLAEAQRNRGNIT